MMVAVIESKWDRFRRNVLNRWTKRRNDQLTKADSERERSIGILQKRYGYTIEQASYQLRRYYSKARLE